MRAPTLLLLTVALVVAGCGDAGGGDLEAFCATARRFAADNPASVFDRYDPTDPGSAALLLRDAGDRLSAWAGEAPAEIDDDVEAIADAAVALADEFELPDAASSEDLQAHLLAVESASVRVLEFTRSQCAVDLEPASTTTTAPPP